MFVYQRVKNCNVFMEESMMWCMEAFAWCNADSKENLEAQPVNDRIAVGQATLNMSEFHDGTLMFFRCQQRQFLPTKLLVPEESLFFFEQQNLCKWGQKMIFQNFDWNLRICKLSRFIPVVPTFIFKPSPSSSGVDAFTDAAAASGAIESPSLGPGTS